MKILYPGKVREKVVPKYRGSCNLCGCQVEVTRDECSIELSEVTFGSSVRTFFCWCPTKDCRNQIRVTEYITR